MKGSRSGGRHARAGRLFPALGPVDDWHRGLIHRRSTHVCACMHTDIIRRQFVCAQRGNSNQYNTVGSKSRPYFGAMLQRVQYTRIMDTRRSPHRYPCHQADHRGMRIAQVCAFHNPYSPTHRGSCPTTTRDTYLKTGIRPYNSADFLHPLCVCASPEGRNRVESDIFFEKNSHCSWWRY